MNQSTKSSSNQKDMDLMLHLSLLLVTLAQMVFSTLLYAKSRIVISSGISLILPLRPFGFSLETSRRLSKNCRDTVLVRVVFRN